MSGIFGLVKTGDLVDRFILEAMADALAHRGPDGYRLWLNGDVGFGHRMLQTTPEAHLETLPFYDPESKIAITSDSRLDNRDELISLVGRGNFKSEVIADSFIILESYKKWGCDCVHHLLGDFSFAIWEANKKRLFCARDHLGVKPFNYCHSSDTFSFCSESRVIAHHSRLPTSIYYPRIADFLTPHLEGIDKISTFYTNIFRLPPGHYLLFSIGQLRITKYWKPEEENHETKIRSDEECIEQLTEILKRSVKNRVRGVDAAVVLSGGIDSATIMSIARNHYHALGGSNLATFSCIADDTTNCVESQAILQLTASEHLEPYLYSPQDFSKHIDTLLPILANCQEPFDFHMVFLFFLYFRAAQTGRKVILDGLDGDMMTSLPNNYPAKLLKNGAARSAILETFSQNKLYSGGRVSFLRLLFRYFAMAYVPENVKAIRRHALNVLQIRRFLRKSVINKDFIQETCLESRLAAFDRDRELTSAIFPKSVYHARFSHPFVIVAIERYNRIASLLSVEPRHPLLSKTVVDFYYSLPWYQFVRRGRTKYLLRMVGQQELDLNICWRIGKEHIGYLFPRKLFSKKKSHLYDLHHNHHHDLRLFYKKECLLHNLQCNTIETAESFRRFRDQTALLFWLLKENNI